MYNPSSASINDVVSLSGKTYIVTKLNPKKFKATDLSTGKTWNIPYFMAEFVRKATPADFLINETLTETAFVLGNIVKFKNGLYVVIGMTSSGLKLVKLGGDYDKYYRNVSPKVCEKVDPSTVLK